MRSWGRRCEFSGTLCNGRWRGWYCWRDAGSPRKAGGHRFAALWFRPDDVQRVARWHDGGRIADAYRRGDTVTSSGHSHERTGVIDASDPDKDTVVVIPEDFNDGSKVLHADLPSTSRLSNTFRIRSSIR